MYTSIREIKSSFPSLTGQMSLIHFPTSGPVSAKTLLNAETMALGVSVAALVFPLQCLLCFLFRKAHSQVTPSTEAEFGTDINPLTHSQ